MKATTLTALICSLGLSCVALAQSAPGGAPGGGAGAAPVTG